MLMEISGAFWLSDSVGRMWEVWGDQAGLGAWDGWKYKGKEKRVGEEWCRSVKAS